MLLKYGREEKRREMDGDGGTTVWCMEYGIYFYIYYVVDMMVFQGISS
jgi:hypothetical protein